MLRLIGCQSVRQWSSFLSLRTDTGGGEGRVRVKVQVPC
jgi:hypothetical protein